MCVSVFVCLSLTLSVVKSLLILCRRIVSSSSGTIEFCEIEPLVSSILFDVSRIKLLLCLSVFLSCILKGTRRERCRSRSLSIQGTFYPVVCVFDSLLSMFFAVHSSVSLSLLSWEKEMPSQSGSRSKRKRIELFYQREAEERDRMCCRTHGMRCDVVSLRNVCW